MNLDRFTYDWWNDKPQRDEEREEDFEPDTEEETDNNKPETTL
jgi:hypothetical protein